MGGTFKSPPASTTWGSSGSSVGGVGTDGGMWVKTNNGNGWGGWESLGGTFWHAPPSYTTWGSGTRSIYGVGSDYGVWYKTYTGNGWGGWNSLGGVFISQVIVISRASGYMDVYGVGENEEV